MDAFSVFHFSMPGFDFREASLWSQKHRPLCPGSEIKFPQFWKFNPIEPLLVEHAKRGGLTFRQDTRLPITTYWRRGEKHYAHGRKYLN